MSFVQPTRKKPIPAKNKMEVVYFIKILLIAIFFITGNSEARPSNDTSWSSKAYYSKIKKFDDLFIENNILNGIIKPIDDRKTGQRVFEVLKNNPEHVGQIDSATGKQTTYREMLDRGIRLALWMKQQGIKPNDIIVSCTHNHLDSYIPLFATLFVDAIFTAWNQNIELNTARHFTNLQTPKLIFTNEKAADVLLEAVALENSTARTIVFGKHPKLSSLSDILNAKTQNEVDSFKIVNEKNPQDGAFIIFTSGTSGFPKAAVLPSRLITSPDSIDISPKKVFKFMFFGSLDGISGLLLTLETIINKGTRIIQTTENSIERFYNTVQKYQVDFVFVPVSVMNDLAKSGSSRKYDLRSLKLIMAGGSKMSKEILLAVKREIPSAFVSQTYGTTEIGGSLASTQPRSQHVEAAGILDPNCKAKIVDINSGEALGPNKIGELYAKTPTMMIGYYKDPSATKEAIDTEGWFHTEDLAYYDESGEIFIVDRIKEMIKYKNYQISPAEIEEILMSHPQVLEAAVVPIPVGVDGERPVAFVKIVPGTNVTKDELMKLTSVLEDYKKLQDIYFMDIPHLPTEKIAKTELKELAQKLATNKPKL